MAFIVENTDLQNTIAPARYYEDRTDEWIPLVHIKELLAQLSKSFYRLKENTEALYTVNFSEDLGTNTIILCKGTVEQTINLSNEDDSSYIGKAITIRKSSEGNAVVNIIPQSGGSIIPSDIGPLRRQGSSVTLIYAGNNTWEAFGELV